MEFIKELLLDSDVNVGYIGEVEDILEITDSLIDDGVTIYFDEEKEFKDIIEDNYILQITKIICEDCGKVKYFIEEVFDEEGYTIPDDTLVTTYVDDDLLDCIEYTALDTEIVPIEFEGYDEDEEDFECDGDCSNCMLEGFEDEDKLEDEETTASVLTDEFLDSLEEIDSDDGEAVYSLLISKFEECYECAKLDVLAELADTVDAIKSLR